MTDIEPIAPRANPILVGHEEPEQRLLDAWRRERVPHSWILSGPPGIGKATLAYRFARFILANPSPRQNQSSMFGALAEAEPGSLDVPETDPVATRVASAGHVDLMTVERAFDEKRQRFKREIAVESVRKIVPFLHRTAGEGGWRVVVVDGADAMNRSSQNALLKILEEPSARGLLLLTADNPGNLLPTIRSRCRLLPMSPLAPTVIDALLARYVPSIEPEVTARVEMLSEGSIGRALRLVADDGLSLYSEIIRILSDWPQIDMVDGHALADTLLRPGTDTRYDLMTELLTWWLGRLAQTVARQDTLQEVVDGEAALMARMVNRAGLEHWLDVWEKVGHAFARAEYANLDRKQTFLSVLGMLGPAHA